MIRNFLIFMLFLGLTACNKGLSYGFEYTIRLNDILFAVKSEKTEFKLDDITLDFYFGGSDIGAMVINDFERVCYTVSFCNSKYLKEVESFTSFHVDYKNINGFYFLRDISEEEYASGDYDVEINYMGKKFNHSERLTVPSEVIELSTGNFCLAVMEVYYSKKDDGYYIGCLEYGGVKYLKIDEQTVQLSRPSSVILSDPS